MAMNLLAITRHSMLLERLRTAFEGAGHCVTAVPDHLHALADEAWSGVHLLLADAKGDPLDGYRLCHLLRAESRVLFRNMPIFIILDHPPDDLDQARLQEMDGDGFIEADASIHTLLATLGPLMEGLTPFSPGPRATILALTLPSARATAQIREVGRHLGLELQLCSRKTLLPAIQDLHPPILFLGLGASIDRTQATMRRLLMAGAMDWLPLPLSGPMLLHACRKAVEWIHIKRIQQECQFQIKDLVEQRRVLELETSALRSEVLTDPLTELLNRRAFNQHLEHAVNQWERHHRSFVLILGDLDYFKLINDRFGHLVGDKVLKAVAQRISSTLRRSDLAFRIGGEEFAILLHESSLSAGAEVAEKIRRRIDEVPVTLESGQKVFPTMSFGVGAQDAADSASLFARVDQSLYMAKRKGRNRIEIMSEYEQ